MEVAVILSGCGYLDGSEIHESVLTLLALSQQDIDYQCFAPNSLQKHTVNHRTQEETAEERNILTESARIARSDIFELEKLIENEYDGVILPGGFGVAKNLSNFAEKGTDCEVSKEFERIIKDFHSKKKPIGAICISPAILGKVLDEKVELTLGQDKGFLSQLLHMGHSPVAAKVNEVIYDKTHNIFSTPGYMEPADLPGMYEGITKLVKKMKEIFFLTQFKEF